MNDREPLPISDGRATYAEHDRRPAKPAATLVAPDVVVEDARGRAFHLSATIDRTVDGSYEVVVQGPRPDVDDRAAVACFGSDREAIAGVPDLMFAWLVRHGRSVGAELRRITS